MFNKDIWQEWEEAAMAATRPNNSTSFVGAHNMYSLTNIDAFTALISYITSSVQYIKGSVNFMQTQFKEKTTQIAALENDLAPTNAVWFTPYIDREISKTRGESMYIEPKQPTLESHS